MNHIGYRTDQARKQNLANNPFLSVHGKASDVLDQTSIATLDGGVIGLSTSRAIPASASRHTGYESGYAGEGIVREIVALRDLEIISSSRVNLGFVGGDSISGYTLWNNLEKDVTVVSVDSDNNDSWIVGLELDDVFRFNSEIQLTFEWNRALVKFDTTITFTFDSGDTVVYHIYGMLSELIPIPPQMPMIEFIENKTDVQIADDGTEQRIGARVRPRLRYAVTFIDHGGTGSEKLFHLMLNSPKKLFQMPSWGEMATAAIKPQIGHTVINANTESINLVPDGYALLIDQRGNFQSVPVGAVTDTWFAIYDPIEVQFYGTVSCIPIRFAYMGARPRIRTFSGGARQLDCELSVVENLTPRAHAMTDYKGIPYFDHGWLMQGDSADSETESNASLLDAGTGTFRMVGGMDGAKPVFNVGVHMETAAGSYELRNILNHLNGRQRAVWVSSQSKDLIPTRSADGAGTSLYVENNGYSATHGAGYVTHIEIKCSDGVVYRREITEVLDVDDVETRLTLEASLGVNYGADEMTVSLLYLCRSARDVFELEWAMVGETYCMLEMIGVKE